MFKSRGFVPEPMYQAHVPRARLVPTPDLLFLVARVGFETKQIYEITKELVESRTEDPSRVDVSARPLVAVGPTKSDLEILLAEALAKAATAGRWDVVAQLARELEARRGAT
jgi:hypothetical protein